MLPLAFSMASQQLFSAEVRPPPSAALDGEAAAATAAAAEAAGSRLPAKQRPAVAAPCDSAPSDDPAQPHGVTAYGGPEAATVVTGVMAQPQPYFAVSPAELEEEAPEEAKLSPLRSSITQQPYCIASLAEAEEAAARVLGKRRSTASVRDSHLRDSLQILQDIGYRKLSTADLVAAVESIADPCAFRNFHFDEPPCGETASTASAATTLTASRRSSRAGTGTPDAGVGGSRRGSCCHSCHDVIANRRRVSCYTEGAATPAMYQCNGTRCGGSHHCPGAFDDPCCGPAAEDFWVQAYYNEERRKRNKRAKAATRAAKNRPAAGARRGSRVPLSGKRGSGMVSDLEASKETVSVADKKRRWVVYICATFVVMLVALAVLMVIVSLTMENKSKMRVNTTTEDVMLETITMPAPEIAFEK